MAKTGRRPGQPQTRAQILQVARDQFAERGYTTTTIRSIAEAAGVHPALLHHYFGTKERLYQAALDMPVDTWAVLDRLLVDTPRAEFAEALVRHFITTWRAPDTGASLRATSRQVFSEADSVHLLRSHWESIVIPQIATRFHLPEHRAALAVAGLFGITFADSYVGLSALQTMSDEDLVALATPVVDLYLRQEG